MMYACRPSPASGSTARARCDFTFEGRQFAGFAGDTLTSALAARGRHDARRAASSITGRAASSARRITTRTTCSRSDGVPNVRGDVAPLADGMASPRSTPSAAWRATARACIERLAPFLPVGFYYKAFHGKRSFPRWERLIRALRGLGSVDVQAPRRAHAEALRVLRRAGGRRRAERAWRRRWRQRSRGAACCWSTRTRGSAAAAAGAACRCARKLAALHRTRRAAPRASKCSARPARRAITRISWVALVEPQRMTKVRARRRGARHGRDRAAGRVSQQRSARRACWARPRSACCIAMPSRRAGAWSSWPRTREGYRRWRATLRAHAGAGRSRARSARERDRSATRRSPRACAATPASMPMEAHGRARTARCVRCESRGDGRRSAASQRDASTAMRC